MLYFFCHVFCVLSCVLSGWWLNASSPSAQFCCITHSLYNIFPFMSCAVKLNNNNNNNNTIPACGGQACETKNSTELSLKIISFSKYHQILHLAPTLLPLLLVQIWCGDLAAFVPGGGTPEVRSSVCALRYAQTIDMPTMVARCASNKTDASREGDRSNEGSN